MNRTIKLLMASDIFVLTGFGLIAPIIAIFINQNISGGNIFTAGLASTLFLVVKSLVQLPFSRYVDSHDRKREFLVFGTLLITSVPFIYILSTDILMIYLAQIVYGLGSGFAYPTWLGLWSTHLDRHHESFEWSVYSTFTGLGAAATAAIGAAIAEFAGFVYTFVLVGAMSLLGCLFLMGLESSEKKAKVEIDHYHKAKKLVMKRSH